MKRFYFMALFGFFCVRIYAQAPAQINYQGVARNSVGSVIADQNISLRLTIRRTSANGAVVYQESKMLRTNNFGLFTTVIGGSAARPLVGSFANIDWAANEIKFLQVEIDPTGGTNFIDMGAAQLSSVPYALSAGTAAPSGKAGGDLTGAYPNPYITNGAITANKIASGAVSTDKLNTEGAASGQVLMFNGTEVVWYTPTINGAASGDLTGTYPAPTINTAAITTEKIKDGSVTASKLAPGLILGGSSLSGQAGGDLSGNYPAPNIASNAVTSSKIDNGAVITPKLADGAVTPVKISGAGATNGQVLSFNGTNVVWNTPASGVFSATAGGDLSGTYPNPILNKIQGVAVSNTAPTNGQVLKYNGSQWVPSADNGGAFTLPYVTSLNSATSLLSITNSGAGSAIEGSNSSTTDNASAIAGRITANLPGQNAAGVKGVNGGTNINGAGVWGEHAGGGTGVYGISKNGYGIFGTSTNGPAGFFDIANATNANDAFYSSTNGKGNGVTAISAYGNGMLGVANDVGGAGIFGFHNADGEGVFGFTYSNVGSGVVGRNDGNYAGVKGINMGSYGIGVLAVAQENGTALIADIKNSSGGNPAVFKVNGNNVARIDGSGKGFFNGGTQLGGADVAESFNVTGKITEYESGDVLVISETEDRSVQKSATAYSNLVAGVYATKPGVLLTEENAEQDQLSNMVPMGVIGVIPTKVCMEGGAIKRGDMLVSSSTPGVAMKANLDKVKVGQVLGKALQDYSSNKVEKINVLVSIK